MEKVKEINLSIRTKTLMVIVTIFNIILAIISFTLLGISSAKLTLYNQSLLMANNPGITYVAYSPNQEQAEEISNIKGVEEVTTMRIIERNNLSFTNSIVPFFAIESIKNENSLENTIFNNVLKGDYILSNDEIYFDQILYNKSNVKIGEKISVYFGTINKTYTLGGVVAPVRDILTLNSEGVAIFNYSQDIDEGLTSDTRITCLTITTNGNDLDSDDLLRYLGNYKPLGNILTFKQFDEDYRNMHNQGSYTDEEYEKIILEAYEKYYDENYQLLPNGQYCNCETFFRDLTSSFELKSIKESSNNYSVLFAILICVSSLIQIIFLFLPNIKNDFSNSIAEGLNRKTLSKHIIFIYDMPYWFFYTIGYILFLVLDITNVYSITTIYYFVSTIILILTIVLSLIRNKIITKIINNKK